MVEYLNLSSVVLSRKMLYTFEFCFVVVLVPKRYLKGEGGVELDKLNTFKP
jgi:hypothetical protein